MSGSGEGATDAQDLAELAVRLEHALERIAASAHPAGSGAASAVPSTAIGLRLEALIAKLRDALDTDPGEE